MHQSLPWGNALDSLSQNSSTKENMSRQILVILFSVFLFPLPALAEKLVLRLDFSLQAAGNLEPHDWLVVQEWTFQAGAKKKKEFHPYFDQKGMVFAIQEDQLGLLVKRTAIQGATKVKVRWGIRKYPVGANWSAGEERETLMIALAFGKELYDSGIMFLPQVPRVLGVFLGEKEVPGKAYQGRYYKQSARYYCIPCNSAENQVVTTEFEFAQAYQDAFGEKAPEVTGVAIEFDTRKVGEGEAYLESIEFYSP